MLTVQHLSVSNLRDLRPLIRDLSFTLDGPQRLAVIGEEGNGKSALLKAIACPSQLLSWAEVRGTVGYAGERLGYLEQESPAAWNDLPVYSVCLGDEAFSDTDRGELALLCKSLSMSMDLCWSETPFGLLSGGEKVRLRLLLLLCRKPTMLLLDEPGNDLDLDVLEALERFLVSCRLPVLYVSHDERLLTATATQVLHLESLYGRAEPKWTWVKEPYALYVRHRREQLDRREALWQADRRERRQQEEKLRRIENAVEHAQATISRQDPHGGRLLKKKMKAVKSLEHRYAREAENALERPYEEYPMQALFCDADPIPQGKWVLQLHLDQLKAGSKVLASPVDLRVRGPEKLLLTGPNGCGKTTLLRLIAGLLRDDSTLRAAYMPQHYEEVLPEADTPEAFLHTLGTKEQLTRIRSSLVAMKFAREELAHPIASLSGGQKAKVLLLSLMLKQPHVLLLDEPTRNLSPLSAPVLREAILSFPGAVLCVTHDRVLMEEWPGRILRLTRDGLSALPSPAERTEEGLPHA